jgi:hypothetical protein
MSHPRPQVPVRPGEKAIPTKHTNVTAIFEFVFDMRPCLIFEKRDCFAP